MKLYIDCTNYVISERLVIYVQAVNLKK